MLNPEPPETFKNILLCPVSYYRSWVTQFQSVMTCNRGQRNRFRSFKILPPGLPNLGAMDSMRRVSDVSVEHAFVTINKWIPIRVLLN